MYRYDLDVLRKMVPARKVAETELGCRIINDRCQAVWRGGDGWNVSLNADGTFKDFKTDEHGGPATLYAIARGVTEEEAANYLGDKYCPQFARKAKKGEKYGLKQRRRQPQNRYEELLAQGYAVSAEWHYRRENGEVAYTVVRMDKAGAHKEMLQKTAAGWGLSGATPILYNLPGIKDAKKVYVAEGEKCADALVAHGFPATTNSGGAEHWDESFTDFFKDREVVLLADNDRKGAAHAELLARSISEQAVSVKILRPSSIAKGDVADFFDAGGTAEELRALEAAAPYYIRPRFGIATESEIALAKSLNEHAFRNYEEEHVQNANGGLEVRKHPIAIRQLIMEVRRRFLGFPCRLGSRILFDHDRDTGEILEFEDVDDLFGWISAKSKHNYQWNSASGFVTRREFYSQVFMNARVFEYISSTPQIHPSDNVFYTYPKLPAPSRGHAVFEGLVDYFYPAEPWYRHLIKAYLAAPMWSHPAFPHPGWIIDSVDGKGVGKTTLPNLLCRLYGQEAPIIINRLDLKLNTDDVTKRIVSTEGRKKNILLLDNVVGEFSSEFLAQLITSPAVSGRAPYSKGEETRPNNIVYTITCNSAQLDGDLAVRCFPIFLRRPPNNPGWGREVNDYIERNRLQIYADILDIVSGKNAFWTIQPVTRFPEFEMEVLWTMCGSEEVASEVCGRMQSMQSTVSIDQDYAGQLVDAIRDQLSQVPHTTDGFVSHEYDCVWISSAIFKRWTGKVLGRAVQCQQLRDYARNGLAPNIDPVLDRFGVDHGSRFRGIMWIGDAALKNPALQATAKILGLSQDQVAVVATAKYKEKEE